MIAALPAGVERDHPLARLTTVRTGGPADLFAAPASAVRLEQLLAWAAAENVPVVVIGSGSNLLVGDAGFRGLALKLAGRLTRIEIDGDRVVCGGGARLPRVAARTAAVGLAGLEFGVNIPGTVGGAVRMNANAYGGALSETLAWVEVIGADGARRRTVSELGFGYRTSRIVDGEVVTAAAFVLEPADPDAVKERLASLRARRRDAQPSGIKTFGSTFKNPVGAGSGAVTPQTAGELLEAAGCRGLSIGGARFSPKHANFIENFNAASTADVLALIAEGRRRVREHSGIELSTEVHVIGDV